MFCSQRTTITALMSLCVAVTSAGAQAAAHVVAAGGQHTVTTYRSPTIGNDSIVASRSTLPSQIRAVLDRFPAPTTGLPSISTRFSRDTVSVGANVELVTVTWFPRELRDSLRHLPVVTAPIINGLRAADRQQLPIAAGTLNVRGQLYDRYVSWQPVATLRPGRIEASPAVLTYRRPGSMFLAPEEQMTIRSIVTVLVVRP